MKFNFGLIETKFYFISWILLIFYSIYNIAFTANEYFISNKFEDTYEDFTFGWTWLNRLKDNSDLEWKCFKDLLPNLLFWCVAQIIIAEFLQQYKQQYLPYFYTTISFLFILSNFGLKSLIYSTIQPIFGFLSLQLKNKTIIWIYYIFSLIIINIIKWANFEIYNLFNLTTILTTNGLFWINLRSLSYFLESVDNSEKISIRNIFVMFSYCFYLPYLYIGPLILFTDFKLIFNQSNSNISMRFKNLLKNLCRYLFWFVFVEFVLHYVYINALMFQPQIFKQMNSWSLYGAGYCMGQFFQMKYVVFYGFSSSLAQFERISVPKTPICIGRIHLYSDMWKYFDQGLYRFLLKYIYIPLSANKSSWQKFFASFTCFFFVYVWHGVQYFIAIWSFLNFIGVTIETICYNISKSNFWITKIVNRLDDRMYQRLKCVLAAPLFAMSAISNFYFFAGKEVGDIYIKRFLQGPTYVSAFVLVALYIGSQVSSEIKMFETTKQLKSS